jgi:outer membrane protein insertion porin family
VSVIDTSSVSQGFKKFLNDQLNAGNFTLYNSFRPSFVNSALFSVIWNLNNYGNIESSSGFIRATIENGGTIWNWLDTTLVTDVGLQYFKYVRFNLDLRRINVINSNTTLAYRINGGTAYSYATNKSLPYEKFFFAGGSNSVRAWRPRRLGPGSYKPDISKKPNKDGLYSYSIEKPAEILLEASIEVRKKLFGFVSGAVFIDAGNVWTYEPLTKKVTVGDTEEVIENGNSQFKLDHFYKEIAVGTGFGLRFDFTFLILRFDVGLKVIDPARDENDRFVLDKVRFWKPYADKNADDTWTNFRAPVIYNVGIGYSF